MENQNSDTTRFLSTGVPGLDTILGGGLTSDRLFLIEGEPGTGKTTLALQFLNEGVRRGESVIYITLAETRVELNSVAASHGWSMEGIHVEDIIPDENILHPEQQFTIFHPSEIEMGMTTQRILDAIEKYQPTRVVLDSLSELQLLAESPLRYRRQVLALKQYLAGKGCTTLFLDDRTALSGDLQVRSVAHGVITLELINQDYGSERRRVRIVKYRGIAFRGGSHDYKIVTGGLLVYPRLVAAHTRVVVERQQLSSGLAQLDALTGGGLDEGTSTLISGPPGTGKSSLCSQYAYAATQRGQKAAMFLFEEATNNLLLRSKRPGHGPAGRDRRRPARHPADRPGRNGARRIHAGRDRRRGERRARDRHRQLERLPEGDAGRALSLDPPARAADLPGPARRGDDPGRRASRRHRRQHVDLGGRQLHRRQRHHAALLRGARQGAPGDLGFQEARRQARTHHPACSA